MDDLLNEIETAVNGGAWVLALAGTLALPDMCAAVESENGWATKEKFLNWWSEHLAETYPRLDGEELYQLRNSMLHTGRTSTQKPGARYARFIFVAPADGNVFHNNVLNDALNLDLPTFCRDVIAAVRLWRDEVSTTDAFQRNIEHIVRWHPDGLPPYVGGVPVLS